MSEIKTWEQGFETLNGTPGTNECYWDNRHILEGHSMKTWESITTQIMYVVNNALLDLYIEKPGSDLFHKFKTHVLEYQKTTTPVNMFTWTKGSKGQMVVETKPEVLKNNWISHYILYMIIDDMYFPGIHGKIKNPWNV